MSHPRFTVVPGDDDFDDQLAALWIEDPSIEGVMNKLDIVLRSIPEQAGTAFHYDGRTYHFVRYGGYQVTYEIKADDCQVWLHDVRKH